MVWFSKLRERERGGREGESKQKGKKQKKLERERERRENSKPFKTDSPLDSLLLVRLGVGEAVDGPGLAPEEPAEVRALERCVFVFGVAREERVGERER